MAICALFMTVGLFTITIGESSDTDPFDISAPENLEVLKNGDDVILNWDPADDVEEYKVYYTTDIYGSFVEDWNFTVTENNNWTHTDAQISGDSYYYLVRAVRDGIEGRISKIGFCVKIDLVYDSDSRLHHVSVPRGFNNMEGEIRASDIVKHIEGGTGLDDNEFIDGVVKWDYTVRGYELIYTHTGFGWTGDDFLVEPEASVGLMITDNLTWHVNGVQKEVSMSFVDDAESNLHYISIPYTLFDSDGDGTLTASDIVMDIEGHTEEGSNTNIISVVKWDHTVRDYTEEYTYNDTQEGWFDGEDFIIHHGDGIGIKVQEGANFTWTPTLIEMEFPYVVEFTPKTSIIPLNTNFTFEFSKEMDRQSVEGALTLDDTDVHITWEDDYTLIVEPQQALVPGKDYNITIASSATDISKNRLDGSADGIPGDDFTYSFSVESPPVIEHIPIIRWHTKDDIIIEAKVTDDIELDNVYLEYWFEDKNGSLSMENKENDTFVGEIPALDMESILNYTIYAVDSSGLTSHSGDYSIDILNLTIPVIREISHEYTMMPVDGTMKIEFSKPMIPNIEEAFNVEPNAEFELHWTSDHDLKVFFSELDLETEYTLFINGSMVTDVNGVQLDDDITYSFFSQGAPELELGTSNDVLNKGSNTTLTAEVFADIELEKVSLRYTDTDEVLHDVIAVNTVENSWESVLPEQNRTGEIRYYFTATDVSGITRNTTVNTIMITNPTEIYVDNISAEAGTSFDFTVRISSPVGIRRAVLHYTSPEGDVLSKDLNMQKGDPTDGVWGCQLTAEEGTLNYQVEVIDWDDESIVLPNEPVSMEMRQQTTSGGYLWYLLLFAAASVVVGSVLLKKRSKESTNEVGIFQSSAQADSDEKTTEHIKNVNCTVCFGSISEEDRRHECQGCKNAYHKKCIQELGECPVCGLDPLAGSGVKDEER